jgi:hypothetical protein
MNDRGLNSTVALLPKLKAVLLLALQGEEEAVDLELHTVNFALVAHAARPIAFVKDEPLENLVQSG